jgi:hypothetical protein
MRPVRIGRLVLDRDAKPTGLEDAITLTGAEAEERRRHLDAFGVRLLAYGPSDGSVGASTHV